MYLPNNWFLEFEEYKKTEFRGNEGIYDSFTEEQFEAIKDYFRWRTRSRFKELVANTSLAVRPRKAEVLAEVMGGITDWVYDGCVDTGCLGASHCELGHALRYEHYATSPSTGKQLIFGVNCASDFFGIEPEKLRKINSVQDEILEEVKLIAFVINTGKHKEYFQRFYGDLMDVINVLRAELNDAFGYSWNQQMGNFLKVGLPFTKSMIHRYERVKSGIYQQRLEERRRYGNIIELCGNDPKAVEFVRDGAGRNLFIVKVILAHINTAFDNSDAKELKKRQSLSRLAIQFTETYTKLSEKGVSDFSKFVYSAKEKVYYTKTENGERIATKNEIRDRVPQLIIKEQYYLPDNQVKMLSIFGWGVFGYESLYKDSGCADADTDIEKIVNSGRLMAATLAWLNNEEEFKAAMKQLKNNMVAREYPSEAPDEIKVTRSMEEIIPYIHENCPRNTNNGYYNIARDIAKKAIENDNYSVSVKQANVLRRVYAELIGEQVESQQNNSASAIYNKIDELLENRSNPALQDHQFAFKVIDTVKKYKSVSPKQEAVIEKAYDALVKSRGKQEKANIIFIEDDNGNDSVQSTDSRTEGLFDEGSSDVEKDYEDYDFDEPDEGESVFVDNNTIKKRVKPIWSDNGRVTERMPSISEISEALGVGVLKEDGSNGN